ncbi:autotransporter family porin [Pantoea sp. SORGH_AS 659]|nr:autotransporter family porin [Pantoea sp. SORGH_AS_0659]
MYFHTRLTLIASTMALLSSSCLVHAAPVSIPGGRVSIPGGTVFPDSLTLRGAYGTIGDNSGLPVTIEKGSGVGAGALNMKDGNVAVLNTRISDTTVGGIGVSLNTGTPPPTGSVFTFDNMTDITGALYGVNMVESGTATFTGTRVTGGEAGIFLNGERDVIAPGSPQRPVVDLINATVSGTLGSGVWVEDDSDLFIRGGSISGSTAGVQVSTTGPDAYATATIEQGAQVTSTSGAALALVPRLGSDTMQNINVSVSDSVLTGETYGVGVIPQDNALATSSITLTGTQVSGKLASVGIGENAGVVSLLLKDNTTLASDTGTALSVGSGSTVNVSVQNDLITGSIDNNGTTALTLDSGGVWQGSTQTLSQVQLNTGGRWDVTDSSVVQGDVTNGGTLSLARGNLAGNTLTINGNYTGNNGNLLFNTALGDDASATDRLFITGNASGTTNVSVTNAGGSGAKTLDGIPLIGVGGTSAPGAFKQQGRIVAGAYDYTLTQKGSNWYLDSYSPAPGPVPAPLPGPVPLLVPAPLPGPAPVPAQHVVRPEAGSYIANQAASSMFLTTLHDRAGENRYMNAMNSDGEATSLWLRQVGVHNRFRDGSGQLKTTGNTWVAQLGGDLAQWSSSDNDRYHLGLMAGYGNNQNSTHSTVSGHGSKGSVNGYSVGMYGTWYQNDKDKTGAYVDSQLMYSWFNNKVNGDDISGESYKSKGLTASAETGYTFALGQSGAQDNPTLYFIEPQAQVTWMGVKADDLTETNGTKISSRGDNNIQTRLGVRAFMQGHSHVDNGTERSFQPFVEVNWLHNTKRSGVDMNGVVVEQAGATNVGEVKLGVEGQLTRTVQLWGNVAQDVGGGGYSNTAAMIGVKYVF